MNIKSKIACFFLLFLMFGASGASAQKLWTLEQCVDTALVNNRNVRQQQLSYKSKEIAYRQSKHDLLPDLNGSVGQNFGFGRSLTAENNYVNSNSKTTSFGVGTSLTLFDGMKMKRNIEEKEAELKASGADLEKVEKDIILNVSTVFLQVLQNKELLKNAETQLAITRENIDRTKELIQSGKLAEGEIYELLAQEAKEELSRVQSDNNLKLSLLDLAQVMNLEDYSSLDVAVPENLFQNELSVLSATEVYQSALLNRPEIKSAQYRLQSSEKNVDIAKSGYYPRLTLGANWGTGYYNMSNVPVNPSFGNQFKNNMQTGVSLNLSIPIFNKFQVRSQVQTAQLDVENSKIEIDKTKLDLRKSVEQAYYNAIAARNRWQSAQKSVKASEESYRFASQKFEAGRANQYEANQAKTNLTQAISEQTQAKYEYVFRLKILELMK